MFKRINGLAILIAVIFLLTTAFGSSLAIAADDDPNARGAKWNETQYYTDAWGRTVTVGQFGPDIGMGEQGSFYESRDPMTGAYTSYYSTGMGVGAGGPSAGYWGMYSPAAGPSYGPYAGGGTPQVQSTPGYDTQGYSYGDLWGQSTNYYQAQPNPMAQLMFGLMGYGGGGYGGGGYGGGGYGGGGFGGYSGGYGGGYGGYTGGYGASAYGSYGAPQPFGGGFGGFSPFGGFGGFSGFGGYGGGYGGYPTRIY